MLTVVETLLFQKQWPLYWTEEEWGEFAAFIAERPEAGDVVPGPAAFGRCVGPGLVRASPVV
jgi:hypothetical protein